MIIKGQNIFKLINKEEYNNYEFQSSNEKLSEIIHKAFVKYDLIGVIKKGFPDDEYQMEESKLYLYISKNILISEKEIYEKLVIIIEDWFGESPLHKEVLKDLHLMAKEIYKGINNII